MTKKGSVSVLIVIAVIGLSNSVGQQGPTIVKLQTPAPQATRPALVGQQPTSTLDDLLREALQKNPGIQSALRQVEALRHRVPQAKTLPDPTASVGWAGNIKPFSVQHLDPSSNRAVTVSQSLPYPGKLKLQGEIADREAQLRNGITRQPSASWSPM